MVLVIDEQIIKKLWSLYYEKRLLSSILVLIFVMLFSFSAYASEGNSDVAVYDMEKGGLQVFTIVDDNGENAIVTISNASLTLNSSVKATYSFKYKRLISWSTGVVAQISNGDLVVSKK